MLHHPNLFADGDRLLQLRGVRFRLMKPIIVAMFLSSWVGERCAGQNIAFPHSYPTTSYPSNLPTNDNQTNTNSAVYYPDKQPFTANSLPEFTDSGQGGNITGAKVSASSRTSSGQFPQLFPSSYADFPTRSTTGSFLASPTNVQHDASHTIRSEPSPHPAASAMLASNRTFINHSSVPLESTFNYRQRPEEAESDYGRSMIQSARQSADQFRNLAETSTSISAKIAADNANFADQWANLAESFQLLSDRVGSVTAKLSATTNDYEEVRSKLDHYGLTPTVGLLLRHKKEQLETWQVNDAALRYATDELSRSRQKQLELELVRYDGSDVSGQSATILAEAGIDSSSFQYASLAQQIQGLLYQRDQWLGSLQQGYHDYQQKLGELDSTIAASTKLANDYRTLIDRHITWIRSGDPLNAGDVRDLKNGLASLLDSRRSEDFGYSLKRKWQDDTVGGIGLLACITLILLARWRAKSWMVGIGSRKQMREATPHSRKVVAGVLTIFIAVTIPSVLYALAHWLSHDIVFESTLQAAGALYAASLVALLVEVPRQLLCNYGYVDKHVEVELPRRQRAIAYLTLIGFGLVLAAYVVTLTELIDHGMWRDSAARFGFIAALSLVAWTAHLAFRPSGGFLEPLIAKFGGSVIYRLRFVIYVIGVGFPVTLVLLSAFGYGFTANVLIVRAIITIVSFLIAATLWSGVKILSSQAWQLLTGTTPPRRFDNYGEIKTDSVTSVLGEHYLELKHHLAFLCQCALVIAAIVCFGWLWIDVFPNARMGNPVVWSIQDTVAQSVILGTDTDAATPDRYSQTPTSVVVKTTPITAFHLLLAAATLFVAFQLAKLLPALFDALVLQRVSFDEGMEHFSLVLGRCILFGVGCLIACNLIGIRWQSVQWLAVGLTVGLGFGLQDMVRNLFGGLVVLFEKPARLGDLITVGRITGRVAAQKFRTTVLSDNEGREVIIPNKNFVSEEVVNWMGAGRLNGIPIEVAVNRDERPADVCRMLQELVIEQPDVLLTPAPQATLVCVGKSSQRIEVLAWIEEGKDPSRFRDELLKIVGKFLREKDLLVAPQPPQPAMRDATSESLDTPYRSPSTRSRKRSA